ncbi:MAG: quinolinate synthase NadA [Pseudomonadota bacterium]
MPAKKRYGKYMTQPAIDNSPLIKKIRQLKEKRNAVILAHNYQRDEVQAIADFTGDSLALSRTAAKTTAEVIVFCGVHFMAETASILSPHKTVLMPDPDAGCPMADMITADELRELKKQHPKAVVVTYVNSSAEVKAETDICCTSSNAVKVIESLKDAEEIICVPDKYLGAYISKKTGRNLILWHGYCPTHVRIQPEDIQRQKLAHPTAKVVAHPECTPAVLDFADAVLSTEGICQYAKASDAEEIIFATEIGVLYRLKKENQGKTFHPASDAASCPNMKKTTLEKILWSLEGMVTEVRVPEDIRQRARKAVERMVDIA